MNSSNTVPMRHTTVSGFRRCSSRSIRPGDLRNTLVSQPAGEIQLSGLVAHCRGARFRHFQGSAASVLNVSHGL